jgi:hypothetical protein
VRLDELLNLKDKEVANTWKEIKSLKELVQEAKATEAKTREE